MSGTCFVAAGAGQQLDRAEPVLRQALQITERRIGSNEADDPFGYNKFLRQLVLSDLDDLLELQQPASSLLPRI